MDSFTKKSEKKEGMTMVSTGLKVGRKGAYKTNGGGERYANGSAKHNELSGLGISFCCLQRNIIRLRLHYLLYRPPPIPLPSRNKRQAASCPSFVLFFFACSSIAFSSAPKSYLSFYAFEKSIFLLFFFFFVVRGVGFNRLVFFI